MTLGSLFDGSGTFPFAATQFGLVPLWASEIEPFPIQVTSARFPKMKHLGDVTKINGKEIAPVDVITFGSPCQDLSVAGRRAGLDGERSGLFMEAIRIIKEMNEATNGRYPKYAVWENVPGAFSSHKGEDFRIVLEEFCKVKDGRAAVPRPTDGKWRTAGLIVADGYSLGWRVLDAQFWGVPQRRRRIFLVADFTGQCAGEILFKQDGLQRSFAESRETWHGIRSDSVKCAREASGIDGSGDRGDTTAPPPVILLDNHPHDSRLKVSGDQTALQTLTTRMGTGGNNTPLIVIRGMNILQDPISHEDIAPCLSTGNPKTGQANIGVCYSIDRAAFNQGQNAQYKIGIDSSGISYTLVAKGPGAVCYSAGLHGTKAGTLDANYYKGCGERNGKEREIVACPTPTKWIVRRVTPTECARLQGMPDWWCDGIKHSDAAEYKMWGNGMALPCVLFVMQGIAAQLRKQLLLSIKRR